MTNRTERRHICNEDEMKGIRLIEIFFFFFFFFLRDSLLSPIVLEVSSVVR